MGNWLPAEREVIVTPSAQREDNFTLGGVGLLD